MAGVTDQYRLPFTSHLTPAGRWRKLSETVKPIIQTDHEPARTARLVRGARAARVVTRPTTATPPKPLPTWRGAEMTADAPPACDGGMPLTPVFVIGGLTRPRPAPSTA